MGDPGKSSDAEKLFAAFHQQEADWRAKGLYQYLTDEEKASREQDYRQIEAFQVLENDLENIPGGVDISKTCEDLLSSATNIWHQRHVVAMLVSHTTNLWKQHGDLLNTYDAQYKTLIPALKSGWVSLEAALVERQKVAEEKRKMTDEETTLLARTLDAEYLRSAYQRLRHYSPTAEDMAACNVSAMDFARSMKWEATFTSLRGKAMEDLSLLQDEMEREITHVMGRTRTPAELQEFESHPAFLQKYNQMSLRQKIDEIARKPLDFVKPNRDPILPSQSAPVAKDPTPEECKILWHILDCESIQQLANNYSVACPSEELMRQKRLKDMPQNRQDKWLREWEAKRNSHLSQLDKLLAEIKGKFVDEETYRGHKEELTRFTTHPLVRAQETAMSKASEISKIRAALEKLINADANSPPSPAPAEPTASPPSFGPADYDNLSFLLSSEAAEVHLASMLNLNFTIAYAGKAMDEKERLETSRYWALTYSSTGKILRAIQADMNNKTSTLSDEEKKRLLVFRDDKNFMSYHQKQAVTKQLLDFTKTVADIVQGRLSCPRAPAKSQGPQTAINRDEDYKMLATLLHGDTVQVLSNRLVPLKFDIAIRAKPGFAVLVEQQRTEVFLKWTKRKANLMRELRNMRDATQVNVSEEERKRLTVYKDNPDFIAAHNRNDRTLLLADIQNSIADLSEGTSFLPKNTAGPEENLSANEQSSTEPAQTSHESQQHSKHSNSSKNAEPPKPVTLSKQEPISQSANKVDDTKDTKVSKQTMTREEADLNEGTTNLPKETAVPQANKSSLGQTATEPAQTSDASTSGQQHSNDSNSVNNADPRKRDSRETKGKHTSTENNVEVLLKEDYEGLLMCYLIREFNILIERLVTFVPTPIETNDTEERNESVAKWNEQKRILLQHIETTIALLQEQISKMHVASYYESKLRHINDVDFTNYREPHILMSIYWWYRSSMCLLSNTKVNHNFENDFFKVIASLNCRDDIVSYQKKLLVTEPSADVKVKYNYDQMNQEEQTHFLSQWKDTLALLSTELQTISDSMAQTTAHLPCIEIVEDFIGKVPRHEMFKTYVQSDTFYTSVIELGKLIDEFITHFDTFLSPKNLATVVEMLEHDLIGKYLHIVISIVPIRECYTTESVELLNAEDKRTWMDYWSDVKEPECIEIYDLWLAKQPKTLNDLSKEEKLRLNTIMRMEHVKKLHLRNTHLPDLERAVASVKEKSKHYFCPQLLESAVLTSKDYLLLCLIIDLEYMHANLEDLKKQTLGGETTIHPSVEDEQQWELKKNEYLKHYEMEVQKMNSKLQELCTGQDLTFVTRRLHKFRAQLKFQEQHQRDPQHVLAVQLHEETKKNLITLRDEILGGYLCPICAKQQLLQNDLQLLDQVYIEMKQTKEPSAQCKLLHCFEEMSAEERIKWKQEWYKSLQQVLKEMFNLRCDLETEHIQSCQIKCPFVQVHSNLHREAKFSEYYKAHSRILKISHLYHLAKKIQHEHELGLHSTGSTMTPTELLHLKLLVEMEVLGEVNTKLKSQVSPTVNYLQSLSILPREEPVVVERWKIHLENKLQELCESHTSLQAILERHLLERYPLSCYIDSLRLQTQSQDFIKYHKEDNINLNSAWLFESITKPSLTDLNITDYQSPDENDSTSSFSDSTPDDWYPLVSSPTRTLASSLEGITPLESSSPGLGSYEIETLTSYFNFLKVKEYIQKFAIEKLFVETLNNLNLQDMSESDPEYHWLKARHASHTKERYNKVKRVRDCLKPTYEIVRSGRGENLILGEKKWEPYIEYMKANTAAMERYEDHPLTKEVNQIISAPYIYYPKSDYDVVIGSLQYKELQSLTDLSPGPKSKITSFKETLKSKHAEYERRKSHLVRILHLKGFFEMYIADKDTQWIRKEAESQNKVTKHNEEAMYFDERKKCDYLDCMIAYMLANLKSR
jgi:hypothetical protein